MTEKPPQQHKAIEHPRENIDKSVIGQRRERAQDRIIGEAVLANAIANTELQNIVFEHGHKRERGATIELCLAGNNKISIRPLSEYNVVSMTTSKLPVPSQLRGYLEDRANVRLSKNKQTAELDKQRRIENRDGYDKATLQAILQFLRDNSRGLNVLKQLSIETAKDISQLSIKDSIRLTGYIIASATSYNHDATNGQYNEADSLASLEILERGLKAESSDDVDALGVCRNYADMTISVFKSLQRINPNLRNTYCVSTGGVGSATDGGILVKGESWRHHAWNDFITVLPDNEVVIATVDPTAGHIREDDGKLVNYDQTALRAGTHLRNITTLFRGLGRSMENENAQSIHDFYVKNINDVTNVMREKYKDVLDIPLSARRRLQGLALEYLGVVREFSGRRANMATLPRGIRHLVELVAEDEKTILSPFEFNAVLSVAESNSSEEDRNRLLSLIEKKRQYAIHNNLEEYFKRYELCGSYPVSSVVLPSAK